MRIAVVEIGGDALRAVVSDTDKGPQASTRSRLALPLERTVRRTGRLGPGLLDLVQVTVDRVAATLFRQQVQQTVVVMSSGLASAADLEDLQRRVAEALPARPRLRTAREEAALLAAATRRRLPGGDRPGILDFGDARLLLIPPCGAGGAAELPVGRQDLLAPGITDPRADSARPAIRDRLSDALRRVPGAAAADRLVVVGAAGAALRRFVACRRWGQVVPAHDHLTVPVAELRGLEHELLQAGELGRLLLPAVDPADVDELSLVVTVALGVAQHTGARMLTVCGVDTLDGELVRAAGAGAAPGQDRRDSLRALHHSGHGVRTAVLVEQLAVALEGAHGLDRRGLQLTAEAARLHDLDGDRGVAASHRTGAQRLLASPLPGVDAADQAVLACLVRFQRGRLPGHHFPPFGQLPGEDRRRVQQGTALLRLACALASAGGVTTVHGELDPGLACLHLLGEQLGLALHRAREQVVPVQLLLGRSLVIRAAPAKVAAKAPAAGEEAGRSAVGTVSAAP